MVAFAGRADISLLATTNTFFLKDCCRALPSHRRTCRTLIGWCDGDPTGVTGIRAVAYATTCDAKCDATRHATGQLELLPNARCRYLPDPDFCRAR
jgi:hypothetical protein